ncbi:MAG: Hsp20/alpha crystallin family protein [Gammaproteobacteria bacterium]
MKKTLVIILGLILLAILGGQTYMIYDLQQQLGRLSPKPSLNANDTDRPIPPAPLNDKFFADNWNPYREMQRMQTEMERLFGNALSRYHKNQDFGTFTKMPALDLKEEADRYIVKMDIPGADLSSLTINLENRQLSISMKTEHLQDDESGQHFKRRERFSGTFQRTLALPGPVKESAMTSDYKDWVLTVIVPKA